MNFHNPKNPYYDLSLIQTGDREASPQEFRVVSPLYPGLIGVAEIKRFQCSNTDDYVISVAWSNGEQSLNYPNQLMKA